MKADQSVTQDDLHQMQVIILLFYDKYIGAIRNKRLASITRLFTYLLSVTLQFLFLHQLQSLVSYPQSISIFFELSKIER